MEHGLFKMSRYPEGENEDLVRLSLWSRNREGEPQAVASHETALRLHGLSDLMPGKVHLSVPKGFRKRPPKGVVLHKSDLADGDVEAWNGFAGHRRHSRRRAPPGRGGSHSQGHNLVGTLVSVPS